MGDKNEILRELWDSLTTPIYSILNEEGYNIAHAECREVENNVWLYVDEMDGFELHNDMLPLSNGARYEEKEEPKEGDKPCQNGK